VRHSISFVVFLCASIIAQAQVIGAGPNMPSTDTIKQNNQDTLKKQHIKIDPAYRSYALLRLGIDTFSAWDSTFSFGHRYNKNFQRVSPFADLGYSTTPHKILELPTIRDFGVLPGFNIYQGTDLQAEDLVFYKAVVPQTAFQYTQGSGAFIELDATHTQNFSPTWNFTARFNNHSNQEGIYNFSSGVNHIHRGSTIGNAFKSRNGKFESYLILNWNRARRAETMGYDTAQNRYYSDTISDAFRPRSLYIPSVAGAESVYKTHNHIWENKWNYAGKQYLFYTLQHKKLSYEFYNTGTNDSAKLGGYGFYTKTNTEDSSVWQNWNQKAGLGGQLGQAVYYRAYTEMHRYAYTNKYKTLSNIRFMTSIGGELRSNPILHPRNNWWMQGQFMLVGDFAGNYLLQGRYTKLINKWQIYAGLQAQNTNAYMRQVRWVSNLFNFNSSLNNTQSQLLQGGISGQIPHLQFGLNTTFGNTINPVYFDVDRTYKQVANVQQVSIRATTLLTLGKWNWQNQYLLQQNNQNQYINVPQHTILSSIYFASPAFKKAMFARIGLDFYYQSGHKAYSYNAAIAEFSLTNAQGGNFLLADFFIDGRVKNFEFFAKLEHFNSMYYPSFLNQYSDGALFEPILPINFKLGINWRFFN
jgi:hypothetical protein